MPDSLPSRTDYLNRLRQFDRLVYTAVKYSDASGGIHTTTLGIEATKVYTRLTLSAMTIESILPENPVTHCGLWDFPSIATLARAFVETSHRHLYLSEPNLSPDEAGFRLALFYFHMNSEKYRLYKAAAISEAELASFVEGLPKAKAALLASPIYATLPKHVAKKVRDGNTCMHFDDNEAARRHGLAGERFSAAYRLLSNHAHGAPFATFSQSNERGRGLENDIERFYIDLILRLLIHYVGTVVVAQAKLLSLEQLDPAAFADAQQASVLE